MNIVFRVVGVVIVEDMSDIANIFNDRLAISQSVILRGVGDHVWSCERRCMTLSDTRIIILWMMAKCPTSMSGGSAIVYGPWKRDPGFAACYGQESLSHHPLRVDGAEMEVKKLSPGKLQNGIQDFPGKDLKEHRAWTSYAVSWRNERKRAHRINHTTQW